MNPGDLRRFNDDVGARHEPGVRHDFAELYAGRPFMVLTYRATDLSSWVSFLIDGRIERGWTGDWVIDNSEALDASRAAAG